MPRNRGKQPPETRGKSVRVRFHNGIDSERYTPPHWPADTLDWSLSDPPKPYHITYWQVIA